MYKVRLKHRCEVCNQVLHDDESIKNRLGPICHHKVWGDLKPMDWKPKTAEDFDVDAWEYYLLPEEQQRWEPGLWCEVGFSDVCHVNWALDDEQRTRVIYRHEDWNTKVACEGCYCHLVEYEAAGRPGDDD